MEPTDRAKKNVIVDTCDDNVCIASQVRIKKTVSISPSRSVNMSCVNSPPPTISPGVPPCDTWFEMRKSESNSEKRAPINQYSLNTQSKKKKIRQKSAHISQKSGRPNIYSLCVAEVDAESFAKNHPLKSVCFFSGDIFSSID